MAQNITTRTVNGARHRYIIHDARRFASHDPLDEPWEPEGNTPLPLHAAGPVAAEWRAAIRGTRVSLRSLQKSSVGAKNREFWLNSSGQLTNPTKRHYSFLKRQNVSEFA